MSFRFLRHWFFWTWLLSVDGLIFASMITIGRGSTQIALLSVLLGSILGTFIGAFLIGQQIRRDRWRSRI